MGIWSRQPLLRDQNAHTLVQAKLKAHLMGLILHIHLIT